MNLRSFFPLTGVTILRDSKNSCEIPKIFLSDATYAQDPSLRDEWKKKDIGLVINATLQDPAPDQTQRLYHDLGIDYLWVPINDNDEPIPPGYLDNIINYVQHWTNCSIMSTTDNDTYSDGSDRSDGSYPGSDLFDIGSDRSEEYQTILLSPIDSEAEHQCCRFHRNILIHCSAGINRSGLVAAALLWYTTPYEDRIRFWKTPTDMIEYMRLRQFQDRGLSLLFNPSFYKYLLYYLR